MSVSQEVLWPPESLPPPPTRLHDIGIWFNFGESEENRKVKVANSRKQLCCLYFNYVVRRSTRCMNIALLAIRGSLDPKYPGF